MGRQGVPWGGPRLSQSAAGRHAWSLLGAGGGCFRSVKLFKLLLFPLVLVRFRCAAVLEDVVGGAFGVGFKFFGAGAGLPAHNGRKPRPKWRRQWICERDCRINMATCVAFGLAVLMLWGPMFSPEPSGGLDLWDL